MSRIMRKSHIVGFLMQQLIYKNWCLCPDMTEKKNIVKPQDRHILPMITDMILQTIVITML